MTVSRVSVESLLSAKRILVLGPCGSGKSVLTRRLSEILRLPAVHLDAQFSRPGWISTPQPEWRGVVKSLITRESWILDGTYESTLDLRIPAAEAIVMIDHPRLKSLWDVFRRSMAHRDKPRFDAPPDQPIDLAYLKYIWKYPAKTGTQVEQLIDKHGSKIPVIKLANRRAGEALVSALRNCANRQK